MRKLLPLLFLSLLLSAYSWPTGYKKLIDAEDVNVSNTNLNGSLSTCGSDCTVQEALELLDDAVGGSGTPGGSDTQVQFNDGGSFGGDAGFLFNKTSNHASLDDGTIDQSFIFDHTGATAMTQVLNARESSTSLDSPKTALLGELHLNPSATGTADNLYGVVGSLRTASSTSYANQFFPAGVLGQFIHEGTSTDGGFSIAGIYATGNNISTGRIGSMAGIFIEMPRNQSTAFVNSSIGIYITDPGHVGTSPSNASGLVIDPVSSGSSSNANIYSAGINSGGSSSTETTHGNFFEGATGIGEGIDIGGVLNAILEVDGDDTTGVTVEKVQFQSSNRVLTINSGATVANMRVNKFIAPTLNGVAGGGAETVTNAATLYIDAAPSGSNITITNPYALWVDAGTTRLDGNIDTALTGSRCVETDANGRLTVAAGACGTGGGDDVSVNSSAATGANFLDNIYMDFAIDTGASPDDITSKFNYNAASGNHALSANELAFAANGFVAEGATADDIELYLLFPDPASSDKTLTLPNATDTLVGKATTDTLTNKTLNAADNVIEADTGDSATSFFSDQHAGTDLTADLEEEAHASEHAVGGADSIFDADPNANAVWTWDDTAGEGDWGTMSDFSYSGTAWTIGADKILESHLKAVDAASDEECLTYETTTGDFEWQTCGGGADTNANWKIDVPGYALGSLEAADSIPPLSKDAGTNLDALTSDFDSGTDEGRLIIFELPSDAASGNVTFTVWWSSTATSGNVIWDIRHSGGDIEGESWDSALTTVAAAADAVQGTTDQLTKTTVTETLANLGWTAGDLVQVMLYRDANNASDTLAADARVHHVHIEGPRA